MSNRFVLNETSYHGAGAIREIVPEFKNRGFKKAFVTTDPGLLQFGVTAKVTDLLDEAGIKATFFVVGEFAKAHPEIIEEEIKRVIGG